MTLLRKRVIVTGLKGRKDLNGKKGKVVSYDSERERYHVSIEGTENRNGEFDNVVALKEENLIVHETFRRNRNGTGEFLNKLIGELVKSFGRVFHESNIGISATIFTVLTLNSVKMSYMLGIIFLSLYAIALCATLERKGVLTRDTNLLGRFKRFHRAQEFFLGMRATQIFGSQVSGNHLLAIVAVGIFFFKKYYSSMGGYYSPGDYDDYDDYGSSFSFGGFSFISLIFLGLILYKLDIPRNGLGALRNLNFFEMMYLFRMLEQIFSGRRGRRGGYGYRRPGYGYGGYGRGRRAYY